ncbi:SDR family NAD(P)-dependent oxidoreductase [Kitasatospora sp. NPDC006697]|uniref:SDR family NAD(P)-dependent oxidoreductase n=1 Tax=Kitasatospora sp. NPDC006697 TaxID=3364020 RepID=UPI003691B1A9
MNTLDTFRLDGARILVTGASRGIGRAIALALAEAGARLALGARTAEALKPATDQLSALGAEAFAVPGELAEPGRPAAVVDRAAELLGGLDAVVANAGILPTGPDGAPLLVPLQELPEAALAEVLAVNLHATAALCQRAHHHLRAAGGGSVLIVSSLAGVLGTPLLESYAATKAAQVSLARSLAVGWARQGIRVNALCPGWTRTDMTAFAYDTAPLNDWLLAHVPLGRWAEPPEIAAAALFLLSPAAAYLTGQAVLLDGGTSVADGGLAGIPKPPSPFASASASAD